MAQRKYVMVHTIPVYVYVEDGQVRRVVADDSSLSEPTAIVTGDAVDAGWLDQDEQPLTPEDREQYEQDQTTSEVWPGWDWGW